MREIRQFVLRWLAGCRLRLAARGRHLAGDSGQALAEFAVILGVIGVPLLLGTTDLAFLVYDSIEVSSAAHAGAMYGMTSASAASETSSIVAAVQSEAADFASSSLTIAPTTYYACSAAEGGTQYTGSNNQVNSVALANAAAACPAGAANHYLEFVQVNVSASVTPPFHCPGLPSTFQLNSQSVMEVVQ